MIDFNLIINGETRENVSHSIEGHQSLKETLAFPGTVTTVDFTIMGKFSEQQTLNFIALLSKCWHHLTFMQGRTDVARTAPRPAFFGDPAQPTINTVKNPWKLYKASGMTAVFESFQGGPLRVFKSEETTCFVIKFFEGRPTKEAVCAVAWRLANMAEWVEKYGDQVKLKTEKRMKWASFNEISVHVRQTLEIRPRAHPPGMAPGPRPSRALDERLLDEDAESEYDPEDEE